MHWSLHMVVQEIMTDNPVTVDAAAPLSHVERLLRELDIRHLPVLDGDALTGIISDRDLSPFRTERTGPDGREAVASQIMSADLLTVEPETELSEVIDTMIDQRVGALPVVSTNTRTLVGIVSYIDVLRAIRDDL
jgi:acetoin utilization protein AcuB